MTDGKLGLVQRLEQGPVICAEGYLFELERRGYLQAGAFVPEVVLEAPDVVKQLHREFLRAGSDIIEAFTYYAHREKLRVIDKEHLLEEMNVQALRLAKEIAAEGDALVAGNVCNTNAYSPDDLDSIKAVRRMFEEQIGWAVDAGVDLIIGETFSHTGEALLALEIMRETGLPTVVTMAVHQKAITRDGDDISTSLKKIEDAGATVTGLNCARGPETMLPLLKEARKVVKGHMAALPVPYRTNSDQPTFQSLRDPLHGALCPEGRAFPVALDPFTCHRYEIADFTQKAFELGIRYLGLCCGGAPHTLRALAEALGRKPPASRYSADMSKHFAFGTDKDKVRPEHQAFKDEL